VEATLFKATGAMAWAFLVRKKINRLGEEVPLAWNDYGALLIAKPDFFLT